tara:strand:+ start:476 stop:754 length:279 start_codon:yes stop_codon:yes gene_type:complete
MLESGQRVFKARYATPRYPPFVTAARSLYIVVRWSQRRPSKDELGRPAGISNAKHGTNVERVFQTLQKKSQLDPIGIAPFGLLKQTLCLNLF